MAPHGDTMLSSSTYNTRNNNSSNNNNFAKPPKMMSKVNESPLHRTKSDMSFHIFAKETTKDEAELPPISEVEDAKCECCGMSEECTPEYIERVRSKYLGKWICGLCAEAVKEEMEKNGGKIEEALSTHMNTCARFNKFGRAYPALLTADAMRQILRKGSKSDNGKRNAPKKGGIARSTSCIPAITREINNMTVIN